MCWWQTYVCSGCGIFVDKQPTEGCIGGGEGRFGCLGQQRVPLNDDAEKQCARCKKEAFREAENLRAATCRDNNREALHTTASDKTAKMRRILKDPNQHSADDFTWAKAEDERRLRNHANREEIHGKGFRKEASALRYKEQQVAFELYRKDDPTCPNVRHVKGKDVSPEQGRNTWSVRERKWRRRIPMQRLIKEMPVTVQRRMKETRKLPEERKKDRGMIP